MYKTIGFAAITVLLNACSGSPKHGTPHVQMANPASVFCIQQGGKLRMVKTTQGESGLCMLANGYEIEEWQFFRAHQEPPPSEATVTP